MAGTIEDNRHSERRGRQRIVAAHDLQRQLARDLKKKNNCYSIVHYW